MSRQADGGGEVARALTKVNKNLLQLRLLIQALLDKEGVLYLKEDEDEADLNPPPSPPRRSDRHKVLELPPQDDPPPPPRGSGKHKVLDLPPPASATPRRRGSRGSPGTCSAMW